MGTQRAATTCFVSSVSKSTLTEKDSAFHFFLVLRPTGQRSTGNRSTPYQKKNPQDTMRGVSWPLPWVNLYKGLFLSQAMEPVIKCPAPCLMCVWGASELFRGDHLWTSAVSFSSILSSPDRLSHSTQLLWMEYWWAIKLHSGAPERVTDDIISCGRHPGNTEPLHHPGTPVIYTPSHQAESLLSSEPFHYLGVCLPDRSLPSYKTSPLLQEASVCHFEMTPPQTWQWRTWFFPSWPYFATFRTLYKFSYSV